MENLKKFIQEEVKKLHQIALLEEAKKQIKEELQTLNETKDVKAMYKKAGMTPPDGKGIHTKKFHKCVTSVGDEKGKNPYAICMDSLGKEKAVKASHRTDETIGIEYKQMNENDSRNPQLKAHAIDFIKTVLKLGRKDNLFDFYMKEHNIRQDLLSEFIDIVAEEINKHWWEGMNEGAVLDAKREISKAGIMPKNGVDLRFNMHDEPYVLKTMDTPEVNDWIAKVKSIVPNIIVTTFKKR